MCFPFSFTPGVAAQMEKKRTGPSQADVEAIKVHLLTFECSLYVLMSCELTRNFTTTSCVRRNLKIKNTSYLFSHSATLLIIPVSLRGIAVSKQRMGDLAICVNRARLHSERNTFLYQNGLLTKHVFLVMLMGVLFYCCLSVR